MEKVVEEIEVVGIVEEVGEKDFLMIPNSSIVKNLVKHYRNHLGEYYKKMIFDNWDEQLNLDLTDVLMMEAVMVMKASEEEILKMYFEDATNKWAGMEDKDYFNQVFEVTTELT